MELSSFTSFIEVGATLTVAFVAVEYAKQYTFIVADRVFNFIENIRRSVEECKKLIDESTIDGLGNLTINGCSADIKIEGLKREKEKTIQALNEKEEIEKRYVNDRCNSRSYSALSLFIFIFSSVSLFISGLEELEVVKCFWFVTSIICLFYVISAWIFGENQKSKYWIDYSSLKTAFYVFVIIISFSLITSWVCQKFDYIADFMIEYFYIAILITLFTPYINFIVYALKIRKKSVEIHEHIGETFKPLKTRCKTIQEETSKLSAAYSLALDMEKENKEVKSQEIKIGIVNNVKKTCNVKSSTWRKQSGRKLIK